jgi:hypothetical protein
MGEVGEAFSVNCGDKNGDLVGIICCIILYNRWMVQWRYNGWYNGWYDT